MELRAYALHIRDNSVTEGQLVSAYRYEGRRKIALVFLHTSDLQSNPDAYRIFCQFGFCKLPVSVVGCRISISHDWDAGLRYLDDPSEDIRIMILASLVISCL